MKSRPFAPILLVAASSFALASESTVQTRVNDSTVTVRVPAKTAGESNHMEIEFRDAAGKSWTVELQALPTPLHDAKIFRGELPSRQDSFIGMEIRFPGPRRGSVKKGK